MKTPTRFYSNKHYNSIRRDRWSNRGGGVMIFIRKEYQIIQSIKHESLELIVIQLNLKENSINVICCYKSP